ncbi:hypothetical protein SKAU_G00059170 [Synaphobranchus kaupii]|uniref:Uncharacterized protein n=1 Tax=Synaphobranchus kaupii TaxID=118154 RepID=A0A9Q1G4J6_SYNKA|nr:hypothetical protein SKAU_G00059170 [Synaphobranchus kaupii]
MLCGVLTLEKPSLIFLGKYLVTHRNITFLQPCLWYYKKVIWLRLIARSTVPQGIHQRSGSQTQHGLEYTVVCH